MVRAGVLSPDENGPYKVSIAETLGSELLIHFNISDTQTLCAKVITDSDFKPGQRISISYNKSGVHIFDKITEKAYF